VAGLSGAPAGEQRARPGQGRMVAGALLFVIGFSLIFVLGGVVFGSLGASVREHTDTIARWLGVVTIVMGVVFLGGIGFLQREFKVHRLPTPGLVGAPLLGLAFGAAWTPCLTPTFGAVYSMSLTEGTAGRGAFLMACYCLGLGVPFILVALGVGWLSGALAFVRRHMRVVSGVGGLALIVIGALLVSGEWTMWMAQLRSSVGPYSGISV
jgi:cytochrome c-type biogenesis protein